MSQLDFARNILANLQKELNHLGVKRAVIFGSVARGEAKVDSDIDIYLDFGGTKPSVEKLLKAEGIVIEAFGTYKVDIVSQLESPRGQRLKSRIEVDGVKAF